MMEYRESIVQELKQHSVLAASMFEQAEIALEGSDILYLEMLNRSYRRKTGVYRRSAS